MKITHRVLAAVIGALALTAVSASYAAAPNYDYLDLDYQHASQNSSTSHALGLDGSVDVAPYMALQAGGAHWTETDANMDQWNAGFLLHFPLFEQLNLVAGASYVNITVNPLQNLGPDTTQSGAMVQGGARWTPGSLWEFDALFSHTNLNKGGGSSSAATGLVKYNFSDSVGGFVSGQHASKGGGNTFTIGLRVEF